MYLSKTLNRIKNKLQNFVKDKILTAVNKKMTYL